MQNNKAENATRREHTHGPGDQAMVKADPSRKLEGERWIGPHTVTQVFEDNGTLQLTRKNRHEVALSQNVGTSNR